MSAGRLVVIALLLAAALAGGALYYLQVYGYYEEVVPSPGRDVLLTPQSGAEPQPIRYTGFRGIDAESSPIRYRACFRTDETPADLGVEYIVVNAAEPRNAPRWFDCFDAEDIASGISAGKVQVFLGQKNVAYGVDRLVAITEDGRGFIWHDLNNCGKKAYDGSVIGEECPDRPAAAD